MQSCTSSYINRGEYIISKLNYYISPQTVPYKNLGIEAHLMESVEPSACTIYLWQNHRTVVIGRNQNCYAECNIKALEDDGGYLVRRLSGGGCVYHDEQNLNFTFLINDEDYDVVRQLEVILRAVRKFGLDAQLTGRNDITIDGRKFSGNAFYKSGRKRYHHGTLLVDVDKQAMNRYLIVSRDKLQSKGVSSVKARVINLKDLCPELTVPRLKEALISAFGEVYGAEPQPLTDGDIDWSRVEELETHFASWDWIYGHNVPFSWETVKRFEWGSVQLQLLVKNSVVENANLYSDAMDGEFIGSLPVRLKGVPYTVEALTEALTFPASKEQKKILADLRRMIKENL